MTEVSDEGKKLRPLEELALDKLRVIVHADSKHLSGIEGPFKDILSKGQWDFFVGGAKRVVLSNSHLSNNPRSLGTYELLNSERRDTYEGSPLNGVTIFEYIKVYGPSGNS